MCRYWKQRILWPKKGHKTWNEDRKKGMHTENSSRLNCIQVHCTLKRTCTHVYIPSSYMCTWVSVCIYACIDSLVLDSKKLRQKCTEVWKSVWRMRGNLQTSILRPYRKRLAEIKIPYLLPWGRGYSQQELCIGEIRWHHSRQIK